MNLVRSEQSQGRWARIGGCTVLWQEENSGILQSNLKETGSSLSADISRKLQGKLYLVVQLGSSFQRGYPNIPFVLERRRYLVVDLSSEQLIALNNDERCWMLRPYPQIKLSWMLLKQID
jgi:hypothetical protein